jgi:hypothetical protein
MVIPKHGSSLIGIVFVVVVKSNSTLLASKVCPLGLEPLSPEGQKNITKIEKRTKE